MKIKEAIAVATAVRVNGVLANEIELWGEYNFSAKWINGSGHTYTKEMIDNAKFHQGAFIINNDVVEFYILSPLPTVG